MNEILQHYRPNHREDLIPCMQEIQDAEGYMSQDSMASIAGYFGIPASKVFGLASFYEYFTFAPVRGDLVKICDGTSCHMQGAGKLIREAEKAIQQLESKSKNKLTLRICECQGACSLGPVMQVNGQSFTHVKPEEVKATIERSTDKRGGGQP